MHGGRVVGEGDERAMGDHRKQPLRAAFPFWGAVDVRWGDMDALGHVNNIMYLQYVESARIAFFERFGWPVEAFAARGQGPLVVSQTINYRRPAVYPARLDVGLRPTEVRRSSFVVEFGIFSAGTDEAIADGSVVSVWTDLKAGRSIEVPADLRAGMAGC
jgi:acyl-CoA thioester hydrolase